MSLAFNSNFDARYGEAVEVAPGVRRITALNAGPFTFKGTNTFLIGGTELTVLDPGPEDAAHIDAVLRAIGEDRVAHILLTHSHRDHSAGAGLLQARTGAPILAAAATPAARTEKGSLDEATGAPFAPDAVIPDGAILKAGGMRLEAIATPGHAPDHLAFALQGAGLLFSGDHVMGWATTVVAPPEGSMADYLASLERLLARPERLYLPAHGGPIPDAHSYLRGLRSHRRMRERAILARLAAGDRSVAELVANIYTDLDSRLSAAAALSTLAHLEHLAARGLVARSDAAPLTATYWPGEEPAAAAGAEAELDGAALAD